MSQLQAVHKLLSFSFLLPFINLFFEKQKLKIKIKSVKTSARQASGDSSARSLTPRSLIISVESSEKEVLICPIYCAAQQLTSENKQRLL